MSLVGILPSRDVPCGHPTSEERDRTSAGIQEALYPLSPISVIILVRYTLYIVMELSKCL